MSEDTLRGIRARISQAQASRARAEVELSTAQERRERALETLKTDFGITTADDIQRVSDELQKELDDSLAEALAALDAAGA